MRQTSKRFKASYLWMVMWGSLTDFTMILNLRRFEYGP